MCKCLNTLIGVKSQNITDSLSSCHLEYQFQSIRNSPILQTLCQTRRYWILTEWGVQTFTHATITISFSIYIFKLIQYKVAALCKDCVYFFSIKKYYQQNVRFGEGCTNFCIQRYMWDSFDFKITLYKSQSYSSRTRDKKLYKHRWIIKQIKKIKNHTNIQNCREYR